MCQRGRVRSLAGAFLCKASSIFNELVVGVWGRRSRLRKNLFLAGLGTFVAETGQKRSILEGFALQTTLSNSY
jgi:hypothetical protein